MKCVTCYRSGAGNEDTAVGATEADLNIPHTVLITSGTKAKKTQSDICGQMREIQ